MTDPASRPSALVTGGSRGIGLGIADLLARRGWNLTLAARGVEHLERAAAALEAHGGSVRIAAADMADDAALAEMSARAVTAGTLDGTERLYDLVRAALEAGNATQA